MEASDEELWEACRRLPADWEPFGERKCHGRRRESRPDCDTCRWFVELFRTRPDWGACANPESERAGLLTYREQGCWQHEPEKERRYQATRSARCDFMRRYEMFLREQAAEFIKQEVRKANDPMPDEEPSPTSEHIRQTPLSVVVRRLLRHADEDFRRSAFDGMAASARKDTRRYWEFARCYWSRTLGVDISEIDLPENTRELEEKFWSRVDATISKALEGRGSRPTNDKRKRAG